MPKVIKDVKKKIVDSARRQFLEDGFQAVDIRHIAKDCKIAVGTVYNYYPNKKAIMYDVFQSLWIESIEKLDQMIDAADASEELFPQYASALQLEMKKKKGIGKELFRLEMLDSDASRSIGQFLFEKSSFTQIQQEQIQKVITKSFGTGEHDLQVKNINYLINTTIFLLMNRKDPEAEYIEFVSNLISSYIQEHRIS